MRGLHELLQHYAEPCGSAERLRQRIDAAIASSRGEELLERLACANRRDHQLFVESVDLPAVARAVFHQTTTEERANAKAFDYFIEFSSYCRRPELVESSAFQGLLDEALAKDSFKMHATYLLRMASRRPLLDKIADHYVRRAGQWRDRELDKELKEYIQKPAAR